MYQSTIIFFNNLITNKDVADRRLIHFVLEVYHQIRNY